MLLVECETVVRFVELWQQHLCLFSVSSRQRAAHILRFRFNSAFCFLFFCPQTEPTRSLTFTMIMKFHQLISKRYNCGLVIYMHKGEIDELWEDFCQQLEVNISVDAD